MEGLVDDVSVVGSLGNISDGISCVVVGAEVGRGGGRKDDEFKFLGVGCSYLGRCNDASTLFSVRRTDMEYVRRVEDKGTGFD